MAASKVRKFESLGLIQKETINALDTNTFRSTFGQALSASQKRVLRSLTKYNQIRGYVRTGGQGKTHPIIRIIESRPAVFYLEDLVNGKWQKLNRTKDPNPVVEEFILKNVVLTLRRKADGTWHFNGITVPEKRS